MEAAVEVAVGCHLVRRSCDHRVRNLLRVRPMYIYIYMFTNISRCLRIYPYPYLYLYIYLYRYICLYIYLHISIYIYINVMFIHTHARIYVCMYIDIYVCISMIYVFTYIPPHYTCDARRASEPTNTHARSPRQTADAWGYRWGRAGARRPCAWHPSVRCRRAWRRTGSCVAARSWRR